MLTQPEVDRICRQYEVTCPICGEVNRFSRLKRDVCRPAKTEADGHPLAYRWNVEGYDSVDPKQFFFGVCQRCRFTGDLGDAQFRQASRSRNAYLQQFRPEALRGLLAAAGSGRGLAQALGKRLRPEDPFGSVLAQFHLAVYCECLRASVVHNKIARYYLRIAWLFRDQPLFYPDTDMEALVEDVGKLKRAWARELPESGDYPLRPEMVGSELEALRLSCAFFQRNFETLREAKLEDELRLRHLLAEIGFRIYELSSEEEDFRRASSFYSGIMQQCLQIISDKSIVGGVVNRAKGLLEVCGERGRELRRLHEARGDQAGTPGRRGTSSDPASAREARKRKRKSKAAGGARDGAAPSSGSEQPRSSAEGTPASAPERELEGATRRLGVLEGEAQELRERVRILEEENTKWRRAAGQDRVTGLPNRVTLFNVFLPRFLEEVAQSGAVSCIGVSLDEVGTVNQRHGWRMGDRMLRESAKVLARLRAEDERLYRLEGVQFAFLGAYGLDEARQRAVALRRRLSKAVLRIDDLQLPLTASLGVISVSGRAAAAAGDNVAALEAALLDTLGRAKAKGGNTVEICNTIRF